ncbi:cobalamin-binding protein [Halofilum ochraceum]|uniref:cobalamin-binding protein n=1 Tax=Halofilum ochraceum TaxID=1611323 RepID=UPI0008DA7023|nr:cobalamin-binding protein [Halofilum ochraceum]
MTLRTLFGALLIAVASPAMAGIEVTDDTGRTVRLDDPAERIVSLAPHVTETLFEAGAGDRIVATVNHSDYPPAAEDIPRIGGYDRINIERILDLDPDLVIGWESGNAQAQIQRLQDLGLTLYISEPRELSTIAGSLERFGTLAGTADTAREAARAYRERLAGLRARYADREPIEVFYQIWNNPLMTINDDHLISDVIRGCGGTNVFRDLPKIAPRVSTEAVVMRDPQVIVASGMGEERPEWLDNWKQWSELRAVANGNLYFIPPQYLQRHTPRILIGMERLCEQLVEARG